MPTRHWRSDQQHLKCMHLAILGHDAFHAQECGAVSRLFFLGLDFRMRVAPAHMRRRPNERCGCGMRIAGFSVVTAGVFSYDMGTISTLLDGENILIDLGARYGRRVPYPLYEILPLLGVLFYFLFFSSSRAVCLPALCPLWLRCRGYPSYLGWPGFAN